MCECIKVNYTLVGEEPVTVEVESVDGAYTIEEVGVIEQEGDEWLVSDGLNSCVNCVEVTFNYEGVDYNFNLVKMGIQGGRNFYRYSSPDNTYFFNLNWNGANWNLPSTFAGFINYQTTSDSEYSSDWTPLFGASDILVGLQTSETTVLTCDCKKTNYTYNGQDFSFNLVKTGDFSYGFINDFGDELSLAFNGVDWILYVNSYENTFIANSTTLNGLYYTEDINVTNVNVFECNPQATLSEDTPCPFGVYTIEEGSIFSAFSVAPCGCNCIKITYEFEGVTSTIDVNGNPFVFVFDGEEFSITLTGNTWELIGKDGTIGTIDTPDCPLGDFDLNEDSPFSKFSVKKCENDYKTITYSTVSQGWNSFWSYEPDWMIELNNVFYTFKNGNIWRQNTNTTRNNFYDTQYSSRVKTIFNNNPLENKMFKSISINSNKPWSTSIDTNLETSNTPSVYFVEKEGFWFSYIRRQDNTIAVKALSTQGVGNVLSVTSPNILNFSFNLDLSSISIGDKLYKNNLGSLMYLGEITNLSPNNITIDITFGGIPSVGDFIICVKNSQVESYGARGVYMNIELESDSTEELELFSISSTVFKSFQ